MKTKTTRESVPGVDDPCLRDAWNPGAWNFVWRARMNEMVAKARPGDCGRLMGICEEPESNGRTRPILGAIIFAGVFGAFMWAAIIAMVN
jgi:hypothetical protein